MKYIKKFESIPQPKFKKGDLVYNLDTEELCIVIDVNVTSDIYDDEDSGYLDFQDTYVYRLETKDGGHYDFDWIDEHELRLATEDDIEKYNMKKNISKYNL